MNTNDKLPPRYYRMIKAIDKHERGLWADMSLSECSDTIAWLWKWRKISEEEMHSLCDRMIALFER